MPTEQTIGSNLSDEGFYNIYGVSRDVALQAREDIRQTDVYKAKRAELQQERARRQLAQKARESYRREQIRQTRAHPTSPEAKPTTQTKNDPPPTTLEQSVQIDPTQTNTTQNTDTDIIPPVIDTADTTGVLDLIRDMGPGVLSPTGARIAIDLIGTEAYHAVKGIEDKVVAGVSGVIEDVEDAVVSGGMQGIRGVVRGVSKVGEATTRANEAVEYARHTGDTVSSVIRNSADTLRYTAPNVHRFLTSSKSTVKQRIEAIKQRNAEREQYMEEERERIRRERKIAIDTRAQKKKEALNSEWDKEYRELIELYQPHIPIAPIAF